jgi:hypothetical protein
MIIGRRLQRADHAVRLPLLVAAGAAFVGRSVVGSRLFGHDSAASHAGPYLRDIAWRLENAAVALERRSGLCVWSTVG